MPKPKNINLLPQEEFEASTLGRILKWGMGTFRIIVILTEMVVMTAFLSRFWLDAQNSDLNDTIKTQSAEIASQSDFEKEFRGLQTKLNIFKTISASNRPSDIVNTITANVSGDITLSSISVSEKSVTIQGVAGSEISIAQLVSNLKTVKSFKTVDLGNVSSSTENPSLTDFDIKVTL